MILTRLNKKWSEKKFRSLLWLVYTFINNGKELHETYKEVLVNIKWIQTTFVTKDLNIKELIKQNTIIKQVFEKYFVSVKEV